MKLHTDFTALATSIPAPRLPHPLRAATLAALASAVYLWPTPATQAAPALEQLAVNPPAGNADSSLGNVFFTVDLTTSPKGSSLHYIEAVFAHRGPTGRWDFDKTFEVKALASDHLKKKTGTGGSYSLLVRAPLGQESGSYQLHSIALFDQAGESGKALASSFAAADAEDAFAPLPSGATTPVVIARGDSGPAFGPTDGDGLPPEIRSIAFSKTEVDVTSESAFVEVIVQASDDLSGLDLLDFWLVSPSHEVISAMLSAEEAIVGGRYQDGTFHLRLRIPSGAESGLWKIGGAIFGDRAGNADAPAIAHLATLNVIGGPGGPDAPGGDDSPSDGERLAGSYWGLLQDRLDGETKPGFLRATVSAGGTVTGSILYGGKRYGFKAALDASGRLTLTIPRGKLPPLTFNLGWLADERKLFGTVSDGAGEAEFSTDELSPPGGLELFRHAGRYTLLLPPDAGSADAPVGSGWATASLARDGRAFLVGTLADGTRFSTSGMLSVEGQLPIFRALYGQKGYLAGHVLFPGEEGGSVEGNLDWMKQPSPRQKRFAEGFQTDLAVRGDGFAPPAAGQGLLPDGNYSIGLASDPSGEATVADFTVAGANFQMLGGSPVQLRFFPMSGMFRGSFVEPGTAAKRHFEGIVLRGPGEGAGFYLTPGGAGAAEIQPLP